MMTASLQTKGRGLIGRLFGDTRHESADLYASIVAEARRTEWYSECGVLDTIDGRFEMVVLVLSLTLIRLDDQGDATRLASVQLTERFIDDMDGQIREIGFGDLVVGKQVGGLVAALGGRLSSYRNGPPVEALVRNLWRGAPPDPDEVDHMMSAVGKLRQDIEAVPLADLLAGRVR